MKCHIIQNGGYMFLIVCLWMSVARSRVLKSVYTIQEFCSGNLFIHNIETGDPFQLTIKSEATPTNDKWYQKSKRKCLKEFKTSDPAAHFTVDIADMNIPSCSNCRCNYFEIYVLDYKKRYCGTREIDSFSSKSDTVSIDFHHGFTMRFDVTLTFTVERNSYIITGTPEHEPSHGAASYLETPYFPHPYPPNYRAEYVLRSDDAESHVVLLFLDFQISNQSYVEVAGNNGTHPTRVYGSTFRPPVIVSQRNQLDVKFQSNNQLGMPGFRALISYVRTVDSLSVPHTDCGGLKDGRGGNMYIRTHETFSLYDCVWHVMLPFILSSDHAVHAKLYLSVSIQFKDVGYKSSLEFRNGHNSKSNIVKVINCEVENCSDLNVEMTVVPSGHLYIRFNGYLDAYSALNMSYSIYHTGNCSGNEFLCEDGRCLLPDFRCDGIKQCPTGSDEEECPTIIIPEVRIPPVPSVKRENGLDNSVYKKFFIILLVGSFGLVAVLIAVFIFMCKYRVVPLNVEQALPQVIREMSGVPSTLCTSNMYSNDSPPSYDDFIKSSDCYPPLLYTRAKQRIMPKDICINCTTSFSTGTRTRHHSADSQSYRNSTGSDIFIRNPRDPSQQECSNVCSVVPFNNTTPIASGTIKRWYSLDSRLNDLVKQDTCHLFLSIFQPVCNHAAGHLTQVQCHTLPPNFKLSTTKSSDVKLKERVRLPFHSNRNTVRRCTWSFLPHNASGSDILTVVKSRCCSDPCHGISVHCSLH